MASGSKPGRLQELETLVVLATFLLALSLMSGGNSLVISSIMLLLTGLFVKPVASVISRVWLKFAEFIGAFNSKIILTLVFYLFLTPLAFLYRIFSKNPLQLNRDDTLKSLFLGQTKRYTRNDFEKMH